MANAPCSHVAVVEGSHFHQISYHFEQKKPIKIVKITSLPLLILDTPTAWRKKVRKDSKMTKIEPTRQLYILLVVAHVESIILCGNPGAPNEFLCGSFSLRHPWVQSLLDIVPDYIKSKLHIIPAKVLINEKWYYFVGLRPKRFSRKKNRLKRWELLTSGIFGL